jgi:hypothetical protein
LRGLRASPWGGKQKESERFLHVELLEEIFKFCTFKKRCSVEHMLTPPLLKRLYHLRAARRRVGETLPFCLLLNMKFGENKNEKGRGMKKRRKQKQRREFVSF